MPEDSSDVSPQSKGVLVPQGRTLDDLILKASLADGVLVTSLDEGDKIVVETENSTYRITVLKPGSHEVMAIGGKFLKERIRVRVGGSNFGGSCLKLHAIVLGCHMELYYGDEWLTTSRIRDIWVNGTQITPCAPGVH